MYNPRQQTRMTAWIKCADELPSLFDGPILVYFGDGNTETVRCEDCFKEITDGLDENGDQKFTRWYISQGVTHWALVPAPPTY